jgi:dienelactone hydrolase
LADYSKAMKSSHSLVCTLFLPVVALLLSIAPNLSAQEKRPFEPEDFRHIHNITERGISDDGSVIWYSVAPLQYGDPMVIVYHINKKTTDTLHRTAKLHVAADGSWMAYVKLPPFEEVRKTKLKDPKAAEKFEDTLIVITLTGKETREYLFPEVKSVVTPAMSGGTTLVALLKTPEPRKAPSDTMKPTEENEIIPEPDSRDYPRSPKSAKKGEEKRLQLLILQPNSGMQILEDHVTTAAVSAWGHYLCWITQPLDTFAAQQLYLTPISKIDLTSRYLSEGLLTHPAFSFDEKQFTILEQSDTSDSRNRRVLHFPDVRKGDFTAVYPPAEMVVSNHDAPFFLERNHRLIVSTTFPEPEKVDDTLLKEERFQVDIWKWDEPYIQPQQLKNLEKEKKRGFKALVVPDSDTLLLIEDQVFRNSNLNRSNTINLVLLWDDRPYAIESTWQGVSRNDIYLKDLNNGQQKLLLKAHEGQLSVSPNEAYMVWYSRHDSAWYCILPVTGEQFCITCNVPVPFYNDQHDVPGLPSSFGLAGWGDMGHSVLINTRTDLWRFDLRQKSPPVCITCDGSTKGQIRYRYVRLDQKKLTIEGKEEILLSTFDLVTRDAGFATLNYHKPGRPTPLIAGPFRYSLPEKCKNSDRIIWRRESFNQYPELWFSGVNFRNPVQISQTGKQYDAFFHGTTRVITWKAEDGRSYEGILSMPENRYGRDSLPMMVTFYERHSDDLHRFRGFAPSRSVINTAEYLSHGYVVFEPDIHYKTGTPGQDALNAVVSGTRHVMSLEPIDPKRIGIQGQSWGGYQVAYIITQTNLFAAAMAGAPVSNMTSAYGAIRWESGRARMFQYEEGQSRLGAPLWSGGFVSYFNNSPLFFADSIHTPLLIMHNDNDGAVPWTQSIELFLAMRRLQKPVWMLVYNNEAHNLIKWPNRMDLNIRMKQFFDMYLLDQPKPVWMTDGRPALLKETQTGYELRD